VSIRWQDQPIVISRGEYVSMYRTLEKLRRRVDAMLTRYGLVLNDDERNELTVLCLAAKIVKAQHKDRIHTVRHIETEAS
jgi:hypothetical protein